MKKTMTMLTGAITALALLSSPLAASVASAKGAQTSSSSSTHSLSYKKGGSKVTKSAKKTHIAQRTAKKTVRVKTAKAEKTGRKNASSAHSVSSL